MDSNWKWPVHPNVTILYKTHTKQTDKRQWPKEWGPIKKDIQAEAP